MSSIKMKKFGMIKGVFDNIRGSVNTPSPPGMNNSGPVKLEQEVVEHLHTDLFTAETTVRHGFPINPTAVAYDPVQKILAMGTRTGRVRIFGRPGIDADFTHENEVAIIQIEFVINSGRLLTLCTDNSVNLWDFKSNKTPELVESIEFNREQLTVMHMEFQDKWLYIGTDKGNLHILNMETFTLSGYTGSWNKFIDPMMKTHPGALTQISTNPADSSKILLGFQMGMVCLWDLANKKGEQRYNYNQKLYSMCWHFEGRQFVCSYGDGSLVTWPIKPVQGKPESVKFPHGKKNKETGKLEKKCDPIEKVIWKVNRSSNYESYFVFSGGLPKDDVMGATPSITVMQGGKQTTLLEMENSVLDFLLVTDSPYSADYQDPLAIIVMLNNDLVAIDCKNPKYTCFKNPYAMDFNEPAVTCCKYVVDCPGDIIMDLYRMGNRGMGEFSQGEWPISGGSDTGTESSSYMELVITGHRDGSVRFWDSSSTTMQSLYRIKTMKYLEKTKKNDIEGMPKDPFAITAIDICTDTRELSVSGASGQVLFFRFKKVETPTETKSMEIPIVYEVSSSQQKCPTMNDGSSPSGPQHFEFPTPKPLLNVASQSASYTDPVDGFNFDKPQYEYFSPLKLRVGSQRKTPGYHAELVCLTPWVNNEPPTPISCLSVNSPYGLLAYGNGSGLVIVDIVQFVCLLNMGTADLYGALDPFQRMPKSPKPLDSGIEIVRMDLGCYNQVATPSGDGSQTPSASNAAAAKDSIAPPANRAADRVKSPDCRRLQKAGSSIEDGATAAASGMSKSHSSSVNSLDQIITHEGVTQVYFVDSFPSKNDFNMSACLYVGTTLGSMIAIIINLPDKGEARKTEPVVVSPSGTLYRPKGSGCALTMAFMDSSSTQLTIRGNEPLVNVKHPAKAIGNGAAAHLAHQSSQEDKSPPHNPNTSGSGDQQIAVLVTDKSAYVYALPSQRQMYSQTINESLHVVKAEIINFGGAKYNPCLVAYTADGYIKAYSLPSLRPMVETQFVHEEKKGKIGIICKTMCFSDFGHGIYFCNSAEIQKFSISSAFMRQFPTSLGTVFKEGVPMPEPPKQNFFTGLFSAKPKVCDREELFGESAGKPGQMVAKHTAGSGAMHNAHVKGAAATTEVGKAKQAFVERGQKISELEDRTEAMANEAKEYKNTAHNLMLNAKNKKWYQL